jgi:hypothetical protein
MNLAADENRERLRRAKTLLAMRKAPDPSIRGGSKKIAERDAKSTFAGLRRAAAI